MESKLQGVRINEAGSEASLSIIDSSGIEFDIELHRIERLLVTDLRQQNVIEEMKHWAGGSCSDELEEAAFLLMTGTVKDDCESQLAAVAQDLINRVTRSEIEMMSITAIFGAQVLAAFASMTIRRLSWPKARLGVALA